MTAALEGGEWSAARLGRTSPPGETRYPFYMRLGGPQGRLDGRKISSPPGFDPGPSSPVAQSLYRLSYRAHRNTSYVTDYSRQPIVALISITHLLDRRPVDLNCRNIQFLLSSLHVMGELWPSASCPRLKNVFSL